MTSNSRFAVAMRPLGIALVLVAVIFLGGCKRKYSVPAPPPATPEDIKELIGQLAVKKPVGFVRDIRLPAAKRLAEIGAPAKDAIPALEKMAKDKDPEVKKVAEDALAKLKSS